MNWWENEETAAHYVLFVSGDLRAKRPGSFAELLVRTIFAADPQQRAILRASYPVFVDAVDKYKNEENGYRELAQLAGLRPTD
jgi:hypothetical protein